MPKRGQKTVTVPEEVYERVREEVKKGRERNIARTFIKAVEKYLSRKYEHEEELEWLSEHKKELEKIIEEDKQKFAS